MKNRSNANVSYSEFIGSLEKLRIVIPEDQPSAKELALVKAMEKNGITDPEEAIKRINQANNIDDPLSKEYHYQHLRLSVRPEILIFANDDQQERYLNLLHSRTHKAISERQLMARLEALWQEIRTNKDFEKKYAQSSFSDIN